MVADGIERVREAEARLGRAPAHRIAFEIRAILRRCFVVVHEQALGFTAQETRFAVERALGWNFFGAIQRLHCPTGGKMRARRKQTFVLDEQGVRFDHRVEVRRGLVVAPGFELRVGEEERRLLRVLGLRMRLYIGGESRRCAVPIFQAEVGGRGRRGAFGEVGCLGSRMNETGRGSLASAAAAGRSSTSARRIVAQATTGLERRLLIRTVCAR